LNRNDRRSLRADTDDEQAIVEEAGRRRIAVGAMGEHRARAGGGPALLLGYA
jgi:hypothetical protein